MRSFKSILILSAVFLAGDFLSAEQSNKEKALKVIQSLGDNLGNSGLLAQARDLMGSVEDEDTKIQLATAYALGCYYSGEIKAAEQYKGFIVQSYPTSKYLDYLSGESVQANCENCAGKGEKVKECKRCDGKGKKKCRHCNGSGKRQIEKVGGGKRTVLCACNGSQECKDCEGKGKTYSRCTVCYGAGTVLSKDKVVKAYRALLSNKKPAKSSVDTGGSKAKKELNFDKDGQETERLAALKARREKYEAEKAKQAAKNNKKEQKTDSTKDK